MARHFLIFCAFALFAAPSHGGEFLREDWTASYEPDYSKYWGINWGVTNFLLPHRILHRAKREMEFRWTNNWRFSDGEGGAVIRVFSFMWTYGLFQGGQNLHHSMGHDAAAREFFKDVPGYPSVARRYSQILPKYAGGDELEQTERPSTGAADVISQYMVQPMQAENEFAYAAGKEIMAAESVNIAQMENYMIYRMRFLEDFTEKATLNQEWLDTNGRSSGPGKSEFSSDYTNYLAAVNKRRYGVSQVNDFKIKMKDLMAMHAWQLADPVFLATVWQFGKDWVSRGRNQSHVPMLSLGRGISYMPSLRIYPSIFGIEYYSDHYFRFKGMLANFFYTQGDNRFEYRSGFGAELENIHLWRYLKVGFFGERHTQPFLRLQDTFPMAPGEVGRHKTVYNYGASVKLPILFFDKGEDPARLFLFGKGGRKNRGWTPGEYFEGGSYGQIGAGLRL